MAVQALRDLPPAAPAPRGAPATIPHYPAPRFPTIPRAAYKLGADVTRIYRRWCGPPNPPLKPTPLRGPQTLAILVRDLDMNVIPVYDCGAA